MTHLNMQNRTLGIMDNLPFLRSLNNECIDLIAIDPPFAANETFTGRPRPPITDAELEEEKGVGRKSTASSTTKGREHNRPGHLDLGCQMYTPIGSVRSRTTTLRYSL